MGQEVLNTHCFCCKKNPASLFIRLGGKSKVIRAICGRCRLKYTEGRYCSFVQFEDFNETLKLWKVQEILNE